MNRKCSKVDNNTENHYIETETENAYNENPTDIGDTEIEKQAQDQISLNVMYAMYFNVLSFLSMFTARLQVQSIFAYFLKLKELNDADNQILIRKLVKQNQSLKCKVNLLTSKLKAFEKECQCKKTFCERILTSNKDALDLTGFISLNVFNKIYSYVKPLIRRKWTGANRNYIIQRRYKKSPKKLGPRSKLSGKDEFLLTMMKIRLGLIDTDISKRFGISVSTVSRIFNSYVKSTAAVLKSLVFIPELGSLLATAPPCFRKVKNLHSIIDATEIFLQTPKDLVAQRTTWSDYKHHNTAKILIAVSANSKIIFTSKAYGGRVSDKQLTLDCGYLDKVDAHSELMVDKGFNIGEECATRFIHIHKPPGRRGESQMLISDVRKTEKVANLRILVEQVIRKLKTFQMLARELPITATRNLDDIITICSALVNMHKPIYRN